MDADIHILLAEDNPHDVLFTRKALEDAKIANTLHVVENGAEAIKFLSKEGNYVNAPTPSLLLLDINMPIKSGFDVLDEVKKHPVWRQIPAVVLTSSEAEKDIYTAYDKYVNAYVVKPLDPVKWFNLFKSIESFWFTVVKFSKTQE